MGAREPKTCWNKKLFCFVAWVGVGLCILRLQVKEDEQGEAEGDAGSDAQVESDIHDFRERVRSGDLEGLVSALDNPELFRLACDDDRYMHIVMLGIGVLAWDEPAQASDFLVRFDVAKSRENPESDARRAARSILAALEWRHLESQGLLPVEKVEVLREFLRTYPVLGAQGQRAKALHDDLHERSEFYATFFQKLTQITQVLPRYIFQGDADHRGGESAESSSTIEDSQALEELDDSQLQALSTAVSDLRTALRLGAGQYLMWLLVVGAIVAMPNAMGALVALALIGAYMGLSESKSYARLIRPRLVRLAVEHGVGGKHVVSWLYRLSRKAGRVGSFDIKIQNDMALDLLASVSRHSTPTPE